MITVNNPTLWERLKRWMGFQPTHTVTGALFVANKDGDYVWHDDIIPKEVMEKALMEFKAKKGQVTYIMHASPDLAQTIKEGYPIGVSVEGIPVKGTGHTTGRFSSTQPNKSTPPRGKGNC